MKLSRHSKIRMRERTPFNHKERNTLFKNALRNGKSPQDIKDEKIKDFLISKQNKCKVKLYRNYVFIYSKSNKQLYTMYKLPEELLEEREEK